MYLTVPFYQYLCITLNLFFQNDIELLSNMICQSDTLGSINENTFILAEESAITSKNTSFYIKDKVSLTCLM